VSGQLPTGTEIAGVRIALNAGGSVNFTDRYNVVGGTSGRTTQAALFGNFSLVFDRGSHFFSVTSDLAVSLTDPAYASWASTSDHWDAAALYAYNIGNPYVGPYARASFATRVTPGYLYVENEGGGTVDVTIDHPGAEPTETRTLGEEADQDDLRLKVAKPFAPIVLQEEIGANLKAVSIDLLLLKLTVATRLGFGFRQGMVNDLLVLVDDDAANPRLLEVEDYSTLGPVIGATGNVTFARWLFGAANFGMMAPLKDKDGAGTSFAKRLLVDLSGTAGLKLPPITSFLYASFDYPRRLEKDGYISRAVQFDHSLMARANISLF
jgi:hypothetical protein